MCGMKRCLTVRDTLSGNRTRSVAILITSALIQINYYLFVPITRCNLVTQARIYD